MNGNLYNWITFQPRVGSEMYDQDFDTVKMWLEMKSILFEAYFNTSTTINLTDIMFDKSEILFAHFESKVQHMWQLTKAWLMELENNNFKENFTYAIGEKVEYDYPLTDYRQFSIFKYKYNDDILRSFVKTHIKYINEYENIIVTILNQSRDNTKNYQIFDFRIIMLLLDIALVRCGGDVAETHLLKEVYLIPHFLRNTNYKNYIIEDTISKDWLADILNNQTYYGTSYFYVINDTGNFAFNTWLYAYFSDVELIGVPYGLSEADGKVMCPLQFINHDFFHGKIFIEIKDKGPLLETWLDINDHRDLELKELLIFSLWLLIHEGACLPKECGIEHLIGRTFPGMWRGAWNWTIDLIYPKLVKYAPGHASRLIKFDLFEKFYGANIREESMRAGMEELRQWIQNYDIDGTDANLSSRTLIGCFLLIIGYAEKTIIF